MEHAPGQVVRDGDDVPPLAARHAVVEDGEGVPSRVGRDATDLVVTLAPDGTAVEGADLEDGIVPHVRALAGAFVEELVLAGELVVCDVGAAGHFPAGVRLGKEEIEIETVGIP